MLASFAPHDRDHVARVRDSGNGVEQSRVDPTEDRAVGGDAQRKSDDCDGGKARIPYQLTTRAFNIVEQIVEPNDTASEIEAFLCCLRVAELDSCPATRLFFAQAFALQLIGFELEMRFDLLGKIVCASSASEHD